MVDKGSRGPREESWFSSLPELAQLQVRVGRLAVMHEVVQQTCCANEPAAHPNCSPGLHRPSCHPCPQVARALPLPALHAFSLASKETCALARQCQTHLQLPSQALAEGAPLPASEKTLAEWGRHALHLKLLPLQLEQVMGHQEVDEEEQGQEGGEGQEGDEEEEGQEGQGPGGQQAGVAEQHEGGGAEAPAGAAVGDAGAPEAGAAAAAAGAEAAEAAAGAAAAAEGAGAAAGLGPVALQIQAAQLGHAQAMLQQIHAQLQQQQQQLGQLQALHQSLVSQLAALRQEQQAKEQEMARMQQLLQDLGTALPVAARELEVCEARAYGQPSDTMPEWDSPPGPQLQQQAQQRLEDAQRSHEASSRRMEHINQNLQGVAQAVRSLEANLESVQQQMATVEAQIQQTQQAAQQVEAMVAQAVAENAAAQAQAQAAQEEAAAPEPEPLIPLLPGLARLCTQHLSRLEELTLQHVTFSAADLWALAGGMPPQALAGTAAGAAAGAVPEAAGMGAGPPAGAATVPAAAPVPGMPALPALQRLNLRVGCGGCLCWQPGLCCPVGHLSCGTIHLASPARPPEPLPFRSPISLQGPRYTAWGPGWWEPLSRLPALQSLFLKGYALGPHTGQGLGLMTRLCQLSITDVSALRGRSSCEQGFDVRTNVLVMS